MGYYFPIKILENVEKSTQKKVWVNNNIGIPIQIKNYTLGKNSNCLSTQHATYKLLPNNKLIGNWG